MVCKTCNGIGFVYGYNGRTYTIPCPHCNEPEEDSRSSEELVMADYPCYDHEREE